MRYAIDCFGNSKCRDVFRAVVNRFDDAPPPSLAASESVRTLLFGVTASDGLTLGAVAASLALVTTAACLVPAHSAARIEPSRVFREDYWMERIRILATGGTFNK